MRFPLNSKAIGGYRFGAMTFYGVAHKGTDWVANYWTLYAPTSGRIVATPFDVGGGKWVNFQGDDGALHLFAHLSSQMPVGRYAEGQIIGTTGNTGEYTTGPHLHEQIYINGSLVDPEKYYNNGGSMATDEVWKYINEHRDRLYALEQYDKQLLAWLQADESKYIPMVNNHEARLNQYWTLMNGYVERMNSHDKQLAELKAQCDRIEQAVAKIATNTGISVSLPAEDQVAIGVLKKFLNWVQSFWQK